MNKYRAKSVIVCAQCDAWYEGVGGPVGWPGKCRLCGCVSKIRFPSKAEARRYAELRILEKAGKITTLQCQPEYRFDEGGEHAFTYRADFRYWTDNRCVVEDVKGLDTAVSRLKRKLIEMRFKGTKIEIVRA